MFSNAFRVENPAQCMHFTPTCSLQAVIVKVDDLGLSST